MVKRSVEGLEIKGVEKVLPHIEIREQQQDRLLELIKKGVSLLGDRMLLDRNSTSPKTFYEANGKISATQAGLALIGFIQSVEGALAEYRSWQTSVGNWEGDFVNQVAAKIGLHAGLISQINRSVSAGHTADHILSSHLLNRDGWLDLISQGYAEPLK